MAPATIHDGKIYSPGIRNSFSSDEVNPDTNVCVQTVANLCILEHYLTCVGTKIENLLTIKFYINVFLGPEFLFLVAVTFIEWWFENVDVPEDLDGLDGLALLLPTVHLVAVPGVFPSLGDLDFIFGPFDDFYAAMVG